MGPESKIAYLTIIDEAIQNKSASIDLATSCRDNMDNNPDFDDHGRSQLTHDILSKKGERSQMLEFRAFVAEAGPVSCVTEGADLTLSFTDGARDKMVYSSMRSPVGDILTVTPQSPLGQHIAGLKTGEGFSYAFNGRNYSGRVESVE